MVPSGEKSRTFLVAGTTGLRAVGVNAMIISMLYKATPADVRFIMIDPKMLGTVGVRGDSPICLPVVTE
ncbi:FtsK/SpoIIIE domain-containing protein [Dickeya dadantii]|uniref:FtsK/SpoIIIE domain-containing protein n=1 Tax=Dickeya dadantii TaxID=204038 RepID=UPI001FD4E2E0|nr:FtsK/SpoIIIE domain-containing protein [Dickeya dadantii]